tara:strand:+ start:2329 stop:2514 length:186 start_codon:yes stop_codon:yes gene_type:complete
MLEKEERRAKTSVILILKQRFHHNLTRIFYLSTGTQLTLVQNSITERLDTENLGQLPRIKS